MGVAHESVDLCCVGAQISVEISVGSQQRCQLVLQISIQINPTVAVINQRCTVSHNFVVTLRVIRPALSSRNIAIAEIADTPCIIILALEFLIEGDAGGTAGGEGGGGGGGADVDGFGGVVGAVCYIEYPVIVGARRRRSSRSVVGVLVHTFDRFPRVVLRHVGGVVVDVNA